VVGFKVKDSRIRGDNSVGGYGKNGGVSIGVAVWFGRNC